MATAKYAHKTGLRDRIRLWFRTRKVGAGIVAVIGIAGAVAVAAALLQAPITGSSTVTAPEELQFAGSPAVTATTGDVDCTVALDGTALALDIVGDPGASCDITAMVQVAHPDQTYAVQNITYNTAIDAAFLGESCGTVLLAGNGAQTVTFRLTIPDGAAIGTTPTGDTAGVYAVPETEYVAGDCPQV